MSEEQIKQLFEETVDCVDFKKQADGQYYYTQVRIWFDMFKHGFIASEQLNKVNNE